MKRISVLLYAWWMASLALLPAQESGVPLPVNHATLLGIGKSFLSDSYLSPLTYDGISFLLMHERIHATPYCNNQLLLQEAFFIETAVTKNPTSSAKEYYGNLHCSVNGLYPFLRAKKLRLLAGAGWNAALGGIYNIRNSNNPGSLKLSTNLNLAAMAVYNWRICTFRWQLSTPVVGVFFSPEYGQSYYEIGLVKNGSGTIHLGSLHNQRRVHNYVTVDVALKNNTLRFGYRSDLYNTKVNGLITSIVSHHFVVGVAFESLHFGGREYRKNPTFESPMY